MKILQLRSLRVAYPLTRISEITGRGSSVSSGIPSVISAEMQAAWANAHKLRYKATLSNPKQLCWTDDVGVTEFNEPLPPFKVDEVLGVQPFEAPLTRKQFELAKKSGVIAVSPDRRGEIRTKDIPYVLGGTSVMLSETSIGNPRMQQQAATRHAGPYQWADSSLWDASGALLWPMSNFKPNVSASSGLKARYSVLDGVGTTLLTSRRSEIAAIQRSLLSHFNSVELSDGVVTAGVAELNDSIYDVLTELAELPDTVRMIYDVLRKALMLYRECRGKESALRRSYKDRPPESILDEISSLWLAFRYGVQPLAYSVSDALDYLDSKGVLYRTVRKREDLSSKPDLPHGATLLSTPDIQIRYFGKGRLSASTSQGLGFNPWTTAWELVPLSFVVDWFLNVGDLLGALAPSASFDQTVHTESVRWKQNITILLEERVVPMSIDLYRRRLITPLGHVGLTIDPFIDLKRSLDAMSLSWLTFKSIFRR